MDWRTWAYTRLTQNAPLAAVVPAADVYGAGSLLGAPERRPFIALRFGAETPELRDDEKPVATSTGLTVYMHDDPGDYMRITTGLLLVRNALQGQVVDGVNGICAIWQTDSPDLSDDTFKTILRYSEYRLVGKV